MKKYLFAALVLSSLSGAAFAQTTPPPHAPPPHGGKHAAPPAGASMIDEKTRMCLEKELGKPGQGAPPTKEKFESAMKACNIKPPAQKGH